jgi:hypothetical protein
MISPLQSAVSKGEAASAPRRGLAARWPLFLSVFGALAVSLLLWAGIFWLIGATMRLFANLGS